MLHNKQLHNWSSLYNIKVTKSVKFRLRTYVAWIGEFRNTLQNSESRANV